MPTTNEPTTTTRVVPEGSVVITPAQMYTELRAVHDLVRDLKGVVDPALSDIRGDVADHETRLRSVERRQWFATGIATFVSGGGGALLVKLLG
jgi:hypothetical protein